MPPSVAVKHRRFSAEEKLAFGRRTFPSGAQHELLRQSLASPGCPHRNNSQSLRGSCRRASVPSLKSGTSLPPVASAWDSRSPLTIACTRDLGYDEDCVQEILHKLLPSKELDNGTHVSASKVALPDLDGPTRTPSPSITPRDSSPVSNCSGYASRPCTGDVAFSHGESRKNHQRVLERFRQQLLDKFLSLHDAFSRLNHGVARDRAFTPKEFHIALQRLGVGEEDSDELFAAMDTHCDGGVTLTGFLHSLVDTSPEALLWELRCRLIRVDIRPQHLHKALELIQWPQHGWQSKATEIKRSKARHLRHCSACALGNACPCPDAQGKQDGAATQASCGEGEQEQATTGQEATRSLIRELSYRLTRGDWIKFSTSICLTLLESERLFTFLADESGVVDLRMMFEKLRTTVEPDISLERFRTKLLTQYKTVTAAFDAFSEKLDDDHDTVLRWPGFYALAVKLNVNDKTAENLWGVLTSSPADVGDRQDSVRAGVEVNGMTSITERVFEGHLTRWAPCTALEVLDGQMCERFGNLAETKRALERRLPCPENLSPRDFGGHLRAVGIRNSDVAKALSTVASKQSHTRPGFISLDSTIDTMRATRRRGSKPMAAQAAHSTVKDDTLPIWDQLQTLQNDLRRGPRDELGHRPSSTCETSPKRPAPLNRKKFKSAVDVAVHLSENSRSKFVLHCAERQVLQIEDRWATSPSPSPNAGTPRSVCLPPAAGNRHQKRNSQSRRSSAISSSSSAPSLLSLPHVSESTSSPASVRGGSVLNSRDLMQIELV